MEKVIQVTTKERIIQAALTHFAEHGYEGTTLAMIASDVGIQKPSLYNHFKNKEELYLYIADKVMSELIENMKSCIKKFENRPIDERLKQLLISSSDFIIRKQKGMMYKRFMIFPPAPLKESVRNIAVAGDGEINALLEQLYEQGVDEGFVKISQSTFLSSYYVLLDGLFTEGFIYEEEDFRNRFEDAWHVFWKGISS
ncbi:transcriptional regulator, TetR family [Geomicrobium sp. JCM 19037]|uniref:TetR/AcrR family transcriptional regulator n=1 Tax=Geomicrobium sp. JCM 19037 TaxID=1460634 RepID=UPI00045F3169|nr:TetR/AcrR family transcriptional regulator [Geomicrobium sp. JCM 19037]GAK02800.1 transcriptional regulator, TetR family [Geomicrobium sp. JCM 19037]